MTTAVIGEHEADIISSHIEKAYNKIINSKICLEASFQFENLDIKV